MSPCPMMPVMLQRKQACKPQVACLTKPDTPAISCPWSPRFRTYKQHPRTAPLPLYSQRRTSSTAFPPAPDLGTVALQALALPGRRSVTLSQGLTRDSPSLLPGAPDPLRHSRLCSQPCLGGHDIPQTGLRVAVREASRPAPRMGWLHIIILQVRQRCSASGGRGAGMPATLSNMASRDMWLCRCLALATQHAKNACAADP